MNVTNLGTCRGICGGADRGVSWEHLLGELILGDKLLLDPVWKEIIFPQSDAKKSCKNEIDKRLCFVKVLSAR